MKKRTLLRSIILVVVILLLVIGGNAGAINQITIYLPFVVDGTAESPSATTPPPSTTEPPVATTGSIEIRDISFDGSGSSEPDEYVVIENDDSMPIQLKNWTLSDKASHIFTFPSFVIQPNQTCRIYTNQVHTQWCGFSYGSTSAIWNNSGDTAFLRDSTGNLIDDYSYGDSPSPTTPPPATTEPPPPTTEPPPPTTEPPPSNTGNVVITTVFYDGDIPTTEADEYVEIRNDDSVSIQLSNWTLKDDGDKHTFTFPSFLLAPDQVCRIYTNEYHPEWCGFSFGSGTAVWNNTGDIATLRDGNGTLMDQYSY